MAFNINNLIDRIKRKIGLNGVLAGIYTDNIIRESILNVSLVEFNKYSGFHITTTMDKIFSYWGRPPQINIMDKYDVHVKIPDIIMDQCRMNGVAIKTCTVSPIPMTNNLARRTRLADNMYVLYQYEMQKSNRQEPRFTFRAPDVLVIENYARGVLDIFKLYKLYITCEHPKSLATFTPSTSRLFEDLCMYDVMISMYNNHLAYLKVDIGNGQVELQLDDFRAANDKRTELLDKLETKAANEEVEWIFGL